MQKFVMHSLIKYLVAVKTLKYISFRWFPRYMQKLWASKSKMTSPLLVDGCQFKVS